MRSNIAYAIHKTILKSPSIWFILALSSVLWMFPLIVDRMGATVDMKLHYQWANAFQRSIEEGEWIPHWNNLSNEGLGDATFSHIHPLFYYITTWFDVIFNDLWTSMRWVLFSAHWALGLIVFHFCKSWTTQISAVFAALLAQWMPFFSIQLLMLQQYPTLLALPWAALVLGLSVKARLQARWIIITSAALCGLILSHILIGFITILCITLGMCAMFFINFKKHRKIEIKKSSAISLAGWNFSVALSLLFCAYYLAPAVLDRNLISQQGWNLGAIINSSFGWKNHFSFSLTESYKDHFAKLLFLWLTPLPSLASASIYFFWWRGSKKNGSTSITTPSEKFWVYAFFSLFFSSALSWPLWYFSSTLQQLQFPWRFLALLSLAGAFLAASPAFRLSRTNPRPGYAMLVVALLTFPLSFLCITNTLKSGASTAPNPSWLTGSYGQPEYLPANVPPTWRNAMGTNKPCQTGSPSCSTVRNESHDKEWRVTNKTAGAHLFPVFFHPGWQAYVDDKGTPLEADAKTGFAKIALPAGTHSVEMRWNGTQAQQWGERISLFMLFLTSFLVIIKKVQRRLRHENSGSFWQNFAPSRSA